MNEYSSAFLAALSPRVVWAVSMCAMAIGGVMFRFLPHETGEHMAVARGLAGGVGTVVFAGLLYWWHFS